MDKIMKYIYLKAISTIALSCISLTACSPSPQNKDIANATQPATQAPITSVSAAPADTHLIEFQSWVNANILCKQDFYEQLRSPGFGKNLSDMGVVVSGDNPLGESDEVIDGAMQLSKPIQAFGLPVTRITYWGGSVSEFYVEVESDVQALANSIKKEGLPESKKMDDYDSVWLTHAAMDEDPYPAGVFIRKSKKPAILEVGCRQFDY
jgi:hypothetical protein